MKELLPVTKTLRYLHARGWRAQPVERKLGKRSVDLFGFGDVLGVWRSDSGRVVSAKNCIPRIIIQTTTYPHAKSRARKMIGFEPYVETRKIKGKSVSVECLPAGRSVLDCLLAGFVVELHGWQSIGIATSAIDWRAVEPRIRWRVFAAGKPGSINLNVVDEIGRAVFVSTIVEKVLGLDNAATASVN